MKKSLKRWVVEEARRQIRAGMVLESRGQAKNQVEAILDDYGWKLEDVDRVGSGWDVTVQGEGTRKGRVSISFILTRDGRIRSIEVFGRDREYVEHGPKKLSRLVRPDQVPRIVGMN